MKCFRCKKTARVHFKYSQPLCKKCFLKLLEARVRKYARLNKLFKKHDNILTIDPLSHFLVKKIIGSLPAKIFYKRIKGDNLPKTHDYIKKNKINKIVIPWTIDDDCCLFLEKLFSNKQPKKQRYMSLLQVMTDEEAAIFAKFNKISFILNKKNPHIKHMLDILEKKYPETKFSFVKGIADMKKILKIE